MRKLISVLIVTWNRKNDVIETIQSVYSQRYQDFEIILVDNGSNDGTPEAIQDRFPNVKIIRLDRNMGISAGRNRGIQVSKGSIIFCLDSDASIGKDTLSNVYQKFSQEPKLGVINSKIVNAYTGQIDRIAGWAYSEKDKEDQDREFLSFSFSEGGAAIRREVFEKAGLFWEPLFFGCEGFELSMRILDAGLDILYFPDSLIYHRATKQTRISGGYRDTLFFQNFLIIYFLRFPWWLMSLYMPMKIGSTVVRGFRRGYLGQVWKGLYEFSLKIPFLLKQRKPIRNKTAWQFIKLQRQHGSLRWDLISWLKYKA